MKNTFSLLIKFINVVIAIGTCTFIFLSSLFLNNDEEYIISKVCTISGIAFGILVILYIIDWLFLDPEVAKKYDS